MEPKIRNAILSDLSDLERIVLSEEHEIEDLLLSEYESSTINFIVAQSLSKNQINKLYTIEIESEVVGFVSFYAFNKDKGSVFLGYVLAKAYRGRGFMYSLCHSLISRYFEAYNLDSIKSIIVKQNSISEKLLLKLDFKFVGEMKSEKTKLNPNHRICLYSLNRNDFNNLNNKNYGTR